jgi:exopolysaccharide biosynthesis protein
MWVSGVQGPTPIMILRIDPDYFDFRVHADLEYPRGVAEWQAITGAAALINGAFFEPGDTILGLLVADGAAQGEPFERHGGILTINNDAVAIRSILKQPLEPGEQFENAISGRPMLLYPGGLPVDFDLSPEASRRTVVAQDREGRILFIVNETGTVTLYRMRDWLATSPELNLTTAFNLDGGGSTGLSINMPTKNLLVDSWWGVASALAVYPKQ